MAINFPDSPTNGQTYTDSGTGQTWTYELATNSWTASSLAVTGGVVYKGSVDITAAPPTGAKAGEQWSVGTGGTANAGYGPGVTGTITKGGMVMYTGTGWLEVSHSVPDATTVAKGIDTQKWNRAGTVLSPATAGDVVNISAGTAALPGLTPVGDPDSGLLSPGANQLAISTGGKGRLFIDEKGNVGVGADAVTDIFEVVGSAGIVGTSGIKPVLRLQAGTGITNGFARTTIQFLDQAGSGGYALEGAPDAGRLRISTRSAWVESERLCLTAAGLVGIGTSAPGSALEINAAAATSPFIAKINNAEAVRIDSVGRTLIGTASALNVSGSAGYETLQVQGLGGSLTRFTSTGNGPYLTFARSGSDTVGSNSAVPSSANIGALSFHGADGSTFAQAAEIRVAADGTPATGSMPGFISFLTTPSGATKSLERLRITSAGNVGIGTASPGSALEINAAAATSPFIAKVNNAEKLRIDSTGHVGIGTSAPSTLLHLASVTGSASPTPTELRIATASVGSDWSLTDPWGRISFYNQDSGGGGPKIHAAIDTIVSNILGNASELAFSLSANTSDTLSKRLSIKASGVINIADVPLYADIAAAQAGGLVVGDVFRNTASMLVIVS